jgi:hypothetical protein
MPLQWERPIIRRVPAGSQWPTDKASHRRRSFASNSARDSTQIVLVQRKMKHTSGADMNKIRIGRQESPRFSGSVHELKAIDPELWDQLTRRASIFAAEEKERLRHRKAALLAAKEAGEWEEYILLHDRPDRLRALQVALRSCEQAAAPALVAAVWVDSENIWQNKAKWIAIWKQLSDPRATMDADDALKFAKLREQQRASSRSTPALSPPSLNSATQYLPCSIDTSTERRKKRISVLGAPLLTWIKARTLPRHVLSYGVETDIHCVL